MSSIATFLSSEKEKAQRVYESAILAEASGKKVKDVQSVVDAIATLGLTAADYERAIQNEIEYLRLASVAGEEESLRSAMKEAGDKYASTVERIKMQMKDLESQKKEVAGLYDAARRDYERAHDASCRLAKVTSIQGRMLQGKLDAITSEQKECGRKLNQVREQMQRARIDCNSLQAEFNRTQDQDCHRRYAELQSRIKELSGQESELIKKSEEIRDRYERVRITRGIDEAASGDGTDDL